MNLIKFIFIFSMSLIFQFSHSQKQPKIFAGTEESALKYAWAGGMNSMQFGSIDINMDGKMDLVALDRDGVFNVISEEYQGNRISCFLNSGGIGDIDYDFAPQYSELFPQLYNWAVFVDYNNDGLTDIFTYSPGWGGMKVFKNISTSSLKFELVVSPFLTSYQGGGYTNIFVTYADYPGIYDIDNDGDMDILTFNPLGTFVDLHTNLSMETYGIPDSLLFERTQTCWGKFAESEESNTLYLDSCNNLTNINYNTGKERHTGSTFCILDLNNDGAIDVLLGDIDYPSLIALNNAGGSVDALIDSYDTLFPSAIQKAYAFSMPSAQNIDVNNDGKKDLLVSPFDPGITKSQNKNSVYLYLNTSDNDIPEFTLHTKNFLQNDMLDFGSKANICIYDIDNDGLKDLLVGNYGYYQSSYYDAAMFLHSIYRSRIDFYKNTGNVTKPVFQLWKKDIGSFWSKNKLGLSPAVMDFNDDGKPDILSGNSQGKLMLSHNLGDFEFEVVDTNYLDIDVGDFSYPQLFDLNKDGKQDLIIGERGGNLNYYRNEGSTQNPDFVFVTDSLGNVNITDYSLSYFGYSSPYFYRENDGNTKLLVGSEKGFIYYYENIDGNLNGEFTLSNSLHTLLDTTDISFDRGLRTTVAIDDLNNDNKPEMLVGNYSGGIEYFGTGADVLPGWSDIDYTEAYVEIFPNPAKNSINIKSNNEIRNIEIYTDKGVLLSNYQNINSQEKKINFNYPSGLYYIKLYVFNTFIIKKLIIIN
ncbi:MAG: hypothetical protein C0598_03885 [Marinilabiliales bacterium]|nr:MAG: hypothetical protein C0598_03885 [Marinilabiliales bacterium]